jgi:hypothetical protein
MATVTETGVFRMSDALGRDLGRVLIDGVEGGWMQGTFIPGPDYPTVERHFTYFAELVEGFVLSLTDQAQDAINQLGITLHSPAGSFTAHDAQIDSDNGFACRLPKTNVNGKPAA